MEGMATLRMHTWGATLLSGAAATALLACGADSNVEGDGGLSTVTFDEVHQLIQARCTPTCHQDEADPPSGSHYLVLVDVDAAYGALVSTQSPSRPDEVRSCAGEIRVLPGQPEESLLWRKVTPGIQVCGFKMPPECFGDDCGLASEDADLIYEWIAGGAAR